MLTEKADGVANVSQLVLGHHLSIVLEWCCCFVSADLLDMPCFKSSMIKSHYYSGSGAVVGVDPA